MNDIVNKLLNLPVDISKLTSVSNNSSIQILLTCIQNIIRAIKKTLSKFKMIHDIKSMFSENNGIKLEINRNTFGE